MSSSGLDSDTIDASTSNLATSDSLTIRIRSPSADVPSEFTINSRRTDTIRDVKLRVSQLVNKQADQLHLVYGGAILTDDHQLVNILDHQNTGEMQTMHLVVRRLVQQTKYAKKAVSTSAATTAATALNTPQRPTAATTLSAHGHASMPSSSTSTWPSIHSNVTESTKTTNNAYTCATIDNVTTQEMPLPTLVTAKHTYYQLTLHGRPHLVQIPNSTPHSPAPLPERLAEWTDPTCNARINASSLSRELMNERERLRIRYHALTQLLGLKDNDLLTERMDPVYLNTLSATALNAGSLHPEAGAAAPTQTEEQQQRQHQADQLRLTEEQERQARERVANLWLFVKLAFFSYLFSQEASPTRTLFVYSIALIFYFLQTGRLAIIQAWWTEQRHRWGPVRREPTPVEAAVEQDPAQIADHGILVTFRSFLNQTEHALRTFVASLIPGEPDGPDPLAAEQQGQGGADEGNALL